MDHVLINGQLLPSSEARIPVQDRGFRYGDGVFETLVVEFGVPYQYDWHIQRLAGGLAALGIAYDTAGLRDDVKRLLKKNAVDAGLLRIQVTRGSSGRGYAPGPKAQPTIVIENAVLPTPPSAPVKLWLSALRHLPADALPVRYKLCQGLNSILARMEAGAQQCFDSLLLNAKGELTETSSGNLFWQKNDILYTPALSCGLLEGATRQAVMRLSAAAVNEVAATVETLRDADAVFITNSVWPMLAVDSLMPTEAKWNSAVPAQHLTLMLRQDRADHCATHYGEWQ